MQPTVSIVIPVRNTVKYIRQCLDSAVNQTYRDIEIVIVDDDSTDGTREIIREYAAGDERIKTFYFDEHAGILRARNKGILMSTGKYICCMDSDDYYEVEAMELLVSKMEEVNVDILHFSEEVVNCCNAPEERIEMNRRIVTPCFGRIQGQEVFTACFVDRRCRTSMHNKMFSGDFCRRVIEGSADEFMIRAEDVYEYMLLAYHADSYYGWDSKNLYHYCFGRGSTGKDEVTIEKLKSYCNMHVAYEHMREFCSGKNDGIDHEAILDRYKSEWVKGCLSMINCFPEEKRDEAAHIVFSAWPAPDITESIAGQYWLDYPAAEKHISRITTTPLAEKNVRTIGLYYHRLSIGGAQKVVYLQGCMLTRMGYRVILITDYELAPKDYVIPEAEHVVIQPAKETNRSNYGSRVRMLDRAADEYGIDLVIYHAWASSMLMWDMLLLKIKNIPVITYNHSVFSHSLISHARTFVNRTYPLRYADGIIALSSADEKFWSVFNDNVHHVPNPVAPELLDIEPSEEKKEKTIVWVGRLVKEKQPLDAVAVMEKVVKQIPDAVLYMVGDSLDGKYQKIMADAIVKAGLQDNIILTGYKSDPGEYYRRAKVFLSTSQYEGYPMVLIEAEAYGLPVVMYEMNHLDLSKDEYGVSSVPQKDYVMMACEIVRLLTDEDYYNERSNQARQAFDKLTSYDFEGVWKDILSGKKSTVEVDRATRDMVKLICDHYYAGCDAADVEKKDKKKIARENEEMKKTISDLTARIDKMNKDACKKDINDNNDKKQQSSVKEVKAEDDPVNKMNCRQLYEYHRTLSPDKYIAEARRRFKSNTKRELGDIYDPKTLNEKIIWKALFDNDPRKPVLTDKYLVRDYVREKIGEKYLVGLLGVWDSFDEIDLDKLPSSFVLKANHGCGWNVIIPDKALLDRDAAKHDFDYWMKSNFAAQWLELHYFNIKPKIIAEEYLHNDGDDLYDYKVFCFNGKARFILFISNRKDEMKKQFYDTDWNLQKFTNSKVFYDEDIPKPDNLSELIECSEQLADGFDLVRVDFYRTNEGRWIFGEMTFTPASGISVWNPPEYDRILGDMIEMDVSNAVLPDKSLAERGVEKLPEDFVKIEPNIQRRLKAVEKSNSDLKMTMKKKKDDYDLLEEKISQLEAEKEQLIRKNESLKKQNRKSDKELSDIKNSATYKFARSVGRPLRALKRRIKRGKR